MERLAQMFLSYNLRCAWLTVSAGARRLCSHPAIEQTPETSPVPSQRLPKASFPSLSLSSHSLSPAGTHNLIKATQCCVFHRTGTPHPLTSPYENNENYTIWINAHVHTHTHTYACIHTQTFTPHYSRWENMLKHVFAGENKDLFSTMRLAPW